MDIVDYLRQAGGVARSAQLLRAGFPRRELLRLQAFGAVQPRRGVFALPGCDQALLAAVLYNGRLSCASAAAHYGLWLRKPPTRPHLACNHGHGSGFVRHRTVRFQGDPLLPLAAVEDVALHALSCLPPPASTAMATSAIRLHGVPRELLASQLLADRSGTARRVLRELDIRAESIVEVDLQHLFREHGIGYVPQVFLPGIGRVDFLLGGFLIVEVDGFAFHSKRKDMLRDRARNNAAAVSGYAVLRYMPEHIWFDSSRVIREITTVLAAGQRNPGR
jgi:very-short-patch-repair endonuclease